LHWLVHNQRFSDFSKNRFFCLFLDPSTSAGMYYIIYDFSASTQKLTKFRHKLKKMRVFFGGYCT
jgi:hypothetical protein